MILQNSPLLVQALIKDERSFGIYHLEVTVSHWIFRNLQITPSNSSLFSFCFEWHFSILMRFLSHLSHAGRQTHTTSSRLADNQCGCEKRGMCSHRQERHFHGSVQIESRAAKLHLSQMRGKRKEEKERDATAVHFFANQHGVNFHPCVMLREWRFEILTTRVKP